MIFVCPRCRREKDFGATYIPPLGRSYQCPCGLSTVVRPTWGADGKKTLVSAADPKPKPAPKPEQQEVVAVAVDRVKERLAAEKASADKAAAERAATRAAAARAAETERGPAATPAVVAAPSAEAAPNPPSGATTRNGGPAAPSADSGVVPAAPDERPSALRSRPLGFVEVGPEPPEEPVVRPPIAPAFGGDDAPAGNGGTPSSRPVLAWRGGVAPAAADAVSTRRWTPEERAEAHAENVFEPLAPVLEPKRRNPVPEEDAAAAATTNRWSLDEADAGVTARAGADAAMQDDVLEVTVPDPPAEPAPVVMRERPRAPTPPPAPPAEDRAAVVVREREPPAPAPAPPAVETPDEDGLADTPPEPTAAPRPKRSFRRRLAIGSLRVFLAVIAFAAGFGYLQYRSLQAELPPLDKIKNYRPATVTEVRAPDGTLIGKFYEEERYVVPLEEVPEHVRRAFLAAEDASFYEHSGIDLSSIFRAVVKNVLAGKKAQGGSTISQQVARTFFLSPKKTIKRKVAEMILARRIEKELTKDEILHRYLNQIFFGKGAYGIEAAARIHFGKNVKDLTLAEGALLAGLPQAPSRYAPQSNPDEALRRRAYVLREMANNGWITEEERDAATEEPLALATMPDPTKVLAPFVTEQIRRELIETLGHDVVYREGLQVTSTIDLAKQAAANEAVLAGIERLDKRIGYQGASETVDPAKIDEAAAALGDAAPKAGETVKGIVADVIDDRAAVRLAGGVEGVIHRLDNLWAYPVDPERYFKNRKAEDLRDVLEPGDVVHVTVLDPSASAARKTSKKTDKRPPLALVQEPEVEAALLSFRIPDGRVLAMVGGSDYAKSEYLRPMQAHRQVGSTFKTIVYAAALSRRPPPGTPKEKRDRYRFTLATILQDKPIVMKAAEAELKSSGRKRPLTDEQWKPGNSGDKFYGDTMLRSAYILSRNVPTIDLATKVGLREIIAFARRLGVESDLAPDLSIVLGSGALTLEEISRVHAVFPAGGIAVKPRFIESVVDRDGTVLFELEKELAAAPPKKVVDPKVAYVMTQLMVDVARSGTASAIGRELERPTGGKTGTTNDYVDAWYVGFTPEIVTGVWVGYDQVRSLGIGESGSEAALPIWLDYMKAATEDTPVGRFQPPPGVVKLRIDRATGLLARKDQRPEETVETWFVRGTEPTEIASAGRIKDEPNLFEIDPGLR